MARIHTHYDNLKVARNAPPEVINWIIFTEEEKAAVRARLKKERDSVQR